MRRLTTGFLIGLAGLLALGGDAYAQSSPGWPFGFVPTAGQWNAEFASKMDYHGAPACLTTGCQLTGELFLTASTTSFASMNIPAGAAPTTPNNGDIWSTPTALFARVNGTTFNLTAGGCVNCALTTAANVFTNGPQVIQLNAATLPAALTGAVLEAANADGTASLVDLIGFGATPSYTGRRAGGTNVSPTTVFLGDVLAALYGQGYFGSGWTASAAAGIEIQADQTWSSSAQGTHIDVKTTVDGSTATALAIVCRFENDGGVTCPNTVTGGSKGAGTINASGLFINGVAAAAGGSVTSVALTMPGIFAVSGSPITISGTLGVTLANESANLVFAGPAGGGAAAPTFRSLVIGDIPLLAGTGLQLTGTPNGTVALSAARQTLPTKQIFASGSGTYTTPANVLWIELTLVGGGGGGSGGNAGGGGNGGGVTCWNTSPTAACSSPLYFSSGGGGGQTSGVGGGGGFVGGSSPCDWSAVGGGGSAGSESNATGSTYGTGGAGGNSSLGGGGIGVITGAGGGGGAANTGGGGGGGGVANANTRFGGGGGGAGATCHVIINSPSATYTFAVGGGGAGSAGVGSGGNGGAGGSGVIIVYEHYGS